MERSRAAVLDDLVAADVLAVTDDGGVRATDAFTGARDDYRAAVADEPTDAVRDRLDAASDDAVAVALGEFADDPDLVADYLAVRERVAVDDAVAGVLALLDSLRRPAPADGAPASFTPVHADRLDAYLALVDRAVVYVWRDDCDPCDVLRREFDDLFPEPPRDLALYAVYGPDWAALLERDYDVAGGPTTLFARDGRVDSRLLGAHHRGAIETELDAIRE